ncbi:tol-pal system protein YbgF [Flavimaricola marinus]|uniref:Cell division coordinator CpoB n=1 Tax=Flavimaricola marinus TaxID=1819565 RepID=A0A238LCF8_9RHOB|nr:tol-pal system protein YbgF [Flavimaricola marinus]SMY06610.1 tol-pal system protein YbgF [Flavimaricola marinus]
MMVGRNALLAVVAMVGLLAGPAAAQDQSLADIRQKLSILYVEIQSLRNELNTSGLATTSISGNSSLERLDAIEAELQRLTSKTEELEFRINRITVDGTNRIGDLEFRLCELEEGCDIGMLGDTPSLGGVDSAAVVPTPQDAPSTDGPQVALSEQIDFDGAQQKLVDGDFQGAADSFTTFVQAYPAGPLTSEAYYLRGQALESLGEMSAAARSYLDGFSGDPEGPLAADALFKLGTSLAALGQVSDACVTLAEVPLRFPGSEAMVDAQSAMRELGCS